MAGRLTHPSSDWPARPAGGGELEILSAGIPATPAFFFPAPPLDPSTRTTELVPEELWPMLAGEQRSLGWSVL